MIETKRPRRTLRSLGAVLAGFLAIVIFSIATDSAMHGTGVFPPLGAPMSDALFLLATAYSLEEPSEMPYGDRRCMVEDKWGNTWQIATYKGERGGA